MNDSIRQSIVALATRFADELLATVWNGLAAKLEAGSAQAVAASVVGGRRVRRTEGDIAAAARQIAAVLGRSAGGLRAEELRKRVGMTRSDLGRPMKMLLAKGLVRKTGAKRATVYSLGANGARATGATKAAGATSSDRRPAAKTARRSRKASTKAKRGAPKKATGKSAASRKTPATKASKATTPAKSASATTANGAAAKTAEA